MTSDCGIQISTCSCDICPMCVDWLTCGSEPGANIWWLILTFILTGRSWFGALSLVGCGYSNWISTNHSSQPHGGPLSSSPSHFHLSLSPFLPPLHPVSLPFTSAFLPFTLSGSLTFLSLLPLLFFLCLSPLKNTVPLRYDGECFLSLSPSFFFSFSSNSHTLLLSFRTKTYFPGFTFK